MEMARESHMDVYGLGKDHDKFVVVLETFAALVREDALAQPAQRQPLTDVIKAAQGVLEWIEIAHRPPLRDLLEVGRTARVRIHALADLKDALAAHGIKENT
jgi:hypothetical protein